MNSDRTDWIAEREMGSSASDKVFARIGRPVRQATGEWSSAVEIVGLSGLTATEAYGEDSMQALLLAASMLRSQLNSLQAKHGLTWLGDADLGIRLEPH